MFTALSSCGNDKSKSNETNTIDEEYSVIENIPAINRVGVCGIRLYVIDSCEYVGYINCSNGDFLTHKGNCKFCQVRKK